MTVKQKENEPELSPCPFCGSEAVVTERSRGFRIECSERFKNCTMNMRTSHFPTVSLAASHWNKREELLNRKMLNALMDLHTATVKLDEICCDMVDNNDARILEAKIYLRSSSKNIDELLKDK